MKIMSNVITLCIGLVFGSAIPFISADTPQHVCEHVGAGKPEDWTQYLERIGYCELHDNLRKVPRWVSWHMRPEYQSENPRLPSSAFKPDFDLPVGGRAELRDYRRSGYDRGHMCPSHDMRRTKAVQLECFHLSNMVPQNSWLNRNTWKELEEQTRKWIAQSQDTYIVCGPVFGLELKTVGAGRVVVPDGLFKVIACLKNNQWHAIGFVCKNDKDGTTPEQWITPIEDIELLTGVRLLTSIPEQERIKLILAHPKSLTDW